MKVNRSFYEEFELDLSGICNLSCPLCTRNYAHAQHLVYANQRELSVIKEQLDTFPNIKRTFLAGQVSEPTLYKDFLEYLKYLKSRDIYIELYSNGTGRTPAFWEQIGEILDENDQVHFTVCGSTQKMHETYRVGSNLDELMLNVLHYQKAGNDNDYCQFIKFEYNKDDEENVQQMRFTNHYTVATEGVRRLNEKVVEPLEGVKPEEIRDRTIKWLFDNMPEEGEVICKSLEDKKIYINQSGDMSACYIHYEYEPNDTFEGDEFDYEDILDFKFHDCALCEKSTRFKIEKLGLDFVC